MSDRPTLVVRPDGVPLGRDAMQALAAIFDVRSAADPRGPALHLESSTAGLPPLDVLEAIGEGAGVWMPAAMEAGDRPSKRDADGLTWVSRRLADSSEDVREYFARTCRLATEEAALGGDEALGRGRVARKYTFAADDRSSEAVVSLLAPAPDGGIGAVVGILWETTASRRIQSRIDAIDAAGAELLRIDTDAVAELDVRQRLQRLEEKIVRSMTDVLHFSTFEVRLIDRETNHLELVINHGLNPLRIGEVIRVDEHDNGISGYVAATGRAYLCRDPDDDLLYHSGLEGARSSLTIPLRLYDNSIIGVLNVESDRAEAFNGDDLEYAELFGRYVAMAMHILDLLVVERYTTNEQAARVVTTELTGPLEEIARRTEAIRSRSRSPSVLAEAARLAEVVESIRRRLDEGVTAPRSLIGAEQAMGHDADLDPELAGKRILLADNEDVTRHGIRDLLRSHGVVVIDCNGGAPTIERLEAMREGAQGFDLVLSDIRMPDRNGYEVFRAAREVDPTIPVVLMTGFGYDPHHSIVRASEEGLDGFLFKPLKAQQLLEALREAMRSGT